MKQENRAYDYESYTLPTKHITIVLFGARLRPSRRRATGQCRSDGSFLRADMPTARQVPVSSVSRIFLGDCYSITINTHILQRPLRTYS